MGLGRGWACIGIQLNYSKTRPWLQGLAKWGRVGPVRAEWGRVGPSRAGQGSVGLGRGWACIGIQLNYSKTRPGYKDRPSGAAWGRFAPSGVGEGLGMHWDSIKLL